VLQKTLPIHLRALPLPEPLAGVELPSFGLDDLPLALRERWPAASFTLLHDESDRSTPAGRAAAAVALAELPIDHAVGVVATRGRQRCGRRRGEGLSCAQAGALRGRAQRAGRRRRQRALAVAALRHVAAHAVFAALARQQGWSITKLGLRTDGKREGF